MHRNDDGDYLPRTQTPGNGDDDDDRGKRRKESSNKMSDKWIGGGLKGEKMNARGGEPAGLSRDRESERASERTKQSHSSYSPWQQKHSAADDCPSTAIQRAGERGGREGAERHSKP